MEILPACPHTHLFQPHTYMATVPSDDPLNNIPLVAAAWSAVTIPLPAPPPGLVPLPEATHSYRGRVMLPLACSTRAVSMVRNYGRGN